MTTTDLQKFRSVYTSDLALRLAWNAIVIGRKDNYKKLRCIYTSDLALRFTVRWSA